MGQQVCGLREQITFLEKRGELIRISKQVSLDFELSAVAKKIASGPALLFENVKNHSIPVVVNTDNSRDRIAACLGTDNYGLVHKYKQAIANPVAPIYVSNGPVQEVVVTEDIDLLRDLPVPVHYGKDAGPYITSGLVVAEIPELGIRNVSYHRLQIAGPDEIRILIQPRHLYEMLQRAESKGETLTVAIVLGNDTASRLAAATWGSKVPFELDEFAIAGALREKAVELVKCKTINVSVPADAEIVIEGRILPGIRRPEGPFAEFTGNYGDVWENPVIKVVAVTHRQDPIFQDLLTFSKEHHLLLGLPYEPTVLETVKAIVPGTKAVNITPGGCGKFHAIISIEKRHEGDGKDAIIGGLYSIRDIKQVVVVDNDVDPFDMSDVEWAISTRFQADRDLVVISGAKGNELDPSCPELAVTAKMGIDATKPLSRGERFEKVEIPGMDKIKLSDYLK